MTKKIILYGYHHLDTIKMVQEEAIRALENTYGILINQKSMNPLSFETDFCYVEFCDLNFRNAYLGKRAKYVFGFSHEDSVLLLHKKTVNDQRITLCELINSIEADK